jgi:hydrogenase expression/formation protein HypC
MQYQAPVFKNFRRYLMCLSIPGKITEIYTNGSLIMGKVDFGGVLKEVCLDYVPEAQTGQYVLIHVGFAISVLDEDEAMARLDMIREIESFEEELNSDEIR